MAGALVWSPGRGSHAEQQDRDRQLVQSVPESKSDAKRIALVIGNGGYTNAPTLKNPPNDATDMAKALADVGFTVEHGVNLTQKQMKFMIRQFGQTLKGGGQGLFYFAGHGVQLRGRNYLIPIDAEISSEADVEDQGVDASLVLGLMDEANNGLNVVILDACRNNPFARSFRSASNGLAQMDAPGGTLIAYATAPGSVASDGDTRNGLYTQELLKHMRLPGLGIEEVFKRVRVSVRNLTQAKQTPWEASSLIGEFYFIPTTKSTNVKTEPAASNPSLSLNSDAIELSYWDTIKNSADPEDFKSYLERYPNGRFADLARRRAQPKPANQVEKTINKVTLRVRADDEKNGWSNSGLLVSRGQRIRISASGRISLGQGRFSAPSGIANESRKDLILKSAPWGALIAVIGDDNDDFIHIGSAAEFAVQRPGVLFLGVNEGMSIDSLKDNSGAYDVEIELLELSP